MGLLTISALTTGTVSGNSTQQDETVIHDASATLTLTVAFPTTPLSGQQFCVSSVGGVTTLTMTSGSTIVAGLTTLAVGGAGTWMYSGSKWAKIK